MAAVVAPAVLIADWDAFAVPDGYCAEVISGELVVTPGPSVDHGRVHDQLVLLFGPLVPAGYVTVSGPEWRLERGGIVTMAPQPDLMVVRRPATGRAVTVAPLLAVEILSPADHQRLADGRTRREGKIDDYAENGLEDFLEVDLTASPVAVIRYELRRGRLTEVDRASGASRLTASLPFGYSIVPANL